MRCRLVGFRAILLGLFACLSSMPGMGGSSIGNYTLGRPLIGGLVCGIRPGRYSDRYYGWLRNAGCIYFSGYTGWNSIYLLTCVQSATLVFRLQWLASNSYGLDAASTEGAALATSFGTMVGTLGTVLFYGTATINLLWQHMRWKAVDEERV